MYIQVHGNFPDNALSLTFFWTCSLKILDCLRGLEYAIKLKWFDLKTFNLRDYEYYESVENGDLNWIIPGKFVAFSTPHDKSRDESGVYLTEISLGNKSCKTV